MACELRRGTDLPLVRRSRHRATDEIGPHISGYILEDGEVRGLVASKGRQEYRGAMPMGGVLDITDVRGKSFRFSCSIVNGCYWAPYPSNTYLQSSRRVTCGDRMETGCGSSA